MTEKGETRPNKTEKDKQYVSTQEHQLSFFTAKKCYFQSVSQSFHWIDSPHFLIFFLCNHVLYFMKPIDTNPGFTSACHEPTHREAVSQCKEIFPRCYHIPDSLHVGFIPHFFSLSTNVFKIFLKIANCIL